MGFTSLTPNPTEAANLGRAVAVEIREALLPLVHLAATLSADIKEYDKKIETLGREKYGHTALLRQVKGVGPITALAYVLTLENPQRCRSNAQRQSQYAESRKAWVLPQHSKAVAKVMPNAHHVCVLQGRKA